MTLTEAVNKIIQEFGVGVVSEKRFLFMLSDYHSFRNNPAEKFICKAIINDNHLSNFLSVNSQEQINFQIDMVVHSISHKYGLKEDLIINVLLNLCKGLPDFSNNYKKGPLPIHKEQRESSLSNIVTLPKRKDTPLIINLRCIIRQLLYGKNIDEVMKENPNLTLRDRVYDTIINSDILNKRGIIKREIVNDTFLLDGTARLDKIIDMIHPKNESNISNVKSKCKRKIRKFDTPLIINLKCIIRQLLYGKNIDEVMKEHPNLTLRDRVYDTIINSDILNKRGIIKREIVNDTFLLDGTARLDNIIDIILPENEIYFYV